MRHRLATALPVLAILLAATLGSATFAADCRAVETASLSPARAYDALLKAHVSDGHVRYDCFKNDEAALDRYVAALETTRVNDLSRSSQLALWINAYNALTLKLMLEHYPGIESIEDIPKSKRWVAERWNVGGKIYSLDQIEHVILRPKFEEPRIHFAIVCASISCPDLRAEIYDGARIEQQLDDATRTFLSDTSKGVLVDGRTLGVSKLFQWFKEDFEPGVVDFVRPYLTDAQRSAIGRKPRVTFLDYDWGLNGE